MDFANAHGIRNVYPIQSYTVAGNAPTKITRVAPSSSGLIIRNDDASLNLYVYLTQRGAATPTISATSCDFSVPAGASLVEGIAGSIDVYIQNSSGSATTSAANSREVAY